MKTAHRCSACGHDSPRWFGRCPSCNAWSTAEDALPDRVEGLRIEALERLQTRTIRLETGIGEVDRVLGGGLVEGSTVLCAGEPGIGKSTLILQLVAALATAGEKCLLVSGEESLDQIALRAQRLGLDAGLIPAAATTSLEAILNASRRERPRLLVVDSIQTIAGDATDNAAGSPMQVRESAAALVRCAKETGTVVVMVGHVTKDGSVAGPKALEHVVDVVVGLEGERHGALRLLRAAKNRFGSCEETGVFVMTERGLEVVEDPSAMFLADRRVGVSGSVVFPSLEGSRPVLVEVQALVTGSTLTQPRRVAIGFEARRLALVLGILDKRLGMSLARQDVFVAAAGGLTVREPGADLAVALAIASAWKNCACDPSTIAVGELGLGGEVRRVPGIERRLAEASRLGFRRAVVPSGVEHAPDDIDLVAVHNIQEALDRARPQLRLA